MLAAANGEACYLHHHKWEQDRFLDIFMFSFLCSCAVTIVFFIWTHKYKEKGNNIYIVQENFCRKDIGKEQGRSAHLFSSWLPKHLGVLSYVSRKQILQKDWQLLKARCWFQLVYAFKNIKQWQKYVSY